MPRTKRNQRRMGFILKAPRSMRLLKALKRRRSNVPLRVYCRKSTGWKSVTPAVIKRCLQSRAVQESRL